MDQEPEKPTPPFIPPPDLSMPPPPPPSPMDGRPQSVAPPLPAREPAAGAVVKLKIREAGDADELMAQGIAPFNTRFIAVMIDLLVATGITILLGMILPGFALKLAWLTGIAYLITRDSLPFLGGQSVGKKAMKIKVVTLEDQSLSGNWEKAAIRNGVLIIPFFPLVELLILLTREDKPDRGRRLGDEWAKTKVVLAPDLPAEEKSE